MAYLNFNKEELVNLQYSLGREILGTNRAGGYFATSLVCCNTRKYHGLFVVPLEQFGGDLHVLLSSLDETVIQHNQSFNLGIHRYQGGVYEPKGHKYCVEASYEPLFALTYRVGGVVLQKEFLWIHDEPQLLVRYTLLEAYSPTTLRLKPFLAFRNVHNLSKENMNVNTNYKELTNGISYKLYEGFPDLNMQLSKKCEFIASPDWYYNIEYTKDKARGLEYKEDLFVPGNFEFPIKQGESVIFSASLGKATPSSLKNKFNKLITDSHPRDSYINCLKYSARQFLVRNDKKEANIIAGYPWLGSLGRATFISMPGVIIYGRNDIKVYKQVLNTMCKRMHGGLFPVYGKGENANYDSADISLWFFKSLQEYGKVVGDNVVWKQYKKYMQTILTAYRDGIPQLLHMSNNGLIWAKENGKALTWMNTIIDGKPITQRGGYAVEINALWYNAICYSLRLAREAGDKKFIQEWEELPALIETNFIATFWNQEAKYLADYVDEYGQNMDIRPNQIFACSLEFSPLSEEIRNEILNVVKGMLLTSRGLRTLAPQNCAYKNECVGNERERGMAYHQGTVYPWLLGPFVEASFRLYGHAFVRTANWIVKQFEEDIHINGICGLSEQYDGDPPFNARGAVWQSSSVGVLLRIMKLIEEYSNNLLTYKINA